MGFREGSQKHLKTCLSPWIQVSFKWKGLKREPRKEFKDIPSILYTYTGTSNSRDISKTEEEEVTLHEMSKKMLAVTMWMSIGVHKYRDWVSMCID